MRKCLAPIFILGPLFQGAARWCDGTSPSQTGGALGSNSIAATDALSIQTSLLSQSLAFMFRSREWTRGSLNSYKLWFQPSLVCSHVKRLYCWLSSKRCRPGGTLLAVTIPAGWAWSLSLQIFPCPFYQKDTSWSLKVGSCQINSLPSSRPAFLP